MTADGFLNQRRRHPVAMTAAIAINAAAIAALLLAKSGYVAPPPPGAIPIIDIFIPPLPEPVEPPPEAQNSKQPAPIPVREVDPPAAPDKTPPIKGTEASPPVGGTPIGSGDAPRVEPAPLPLPVPVLTAPVPLSGAMRDFQPPYPPQLLRTEVEGNAVVRVLVGRDGRVKQVAIISADDPLFADATERQAIRKWRFKPATRDGEPVEAWKQLTVRFEIKG